MLADGMQGNNHDVLTGSDETAQLFSTDWNYYSHDSTSAIGSDSTP
jgi:hypothetical protein